MTPTDVLRPAVPGPAARLVAFALDRIDLPLALLRRFWPVARIRGNVVLTRCDDVREAFLADSAFMVPYRPKLDVIMGGEPFFLGMADSPEYRRDIAAMRAVVRPADIPARLAPATSRRAEELVAAAPGRIEVVDFVRQVTFDVLNDYFGITAPADGDLRVWATRLFEFQFADQGNDPALRKEVDAIGPALRAHIDGLIAARKAAPASPDDVLGRALAAQGAAAPGVDPASLGYADAQIRSALIGFLVGGLPQPPMVAPQALEQLLRRPAALSGAQAAAKAGDDNALGGYVWEALRFDPLAPALPRVAVRDYVLGSGAAIPQGAGVYLSFRSAMRDPRRIADPELFDPARPAHDYMHFGLGLHQCFGMHINLALIPLMLKALLRRDGLARAPGPAGRLTKRGAFADTLTVTYRT